MKGLTLIELLVVITLFSIAAGAIFNIFFSAISSQRKILAEQEILSQISYVMEYMGRAIRMAKKDDIPIKGQSKNCLPGEKVNYAVFDFGRELRFRNYQNQCQRFFLFENRVYEQKDYDAGGSSFSLTSPILAVTSLKFEVLGESQTDNLQPRVTIFMKLESKGRKLQLQTTVSQRDLDVQY
jgi:prepilin-type N-terminal cleavage/methylation domain-containing protein